jgi:hypothetical protein
MHRTHAAVAIVLSASLATCARAHTVTLSIGGPSQYSGFTCLEEGSPSGARPLFARAASSERFTVVADFLEVPINVNAGGDVLLRACMNRQCTPMPGRRSTFSIRRDAVTGTTLEELGATFARALAPWQITANAPDSLVILRVVSTTQSPESVLAADARGEYLAFDRGALMGCAISPPVQFDSVESTIYLALPVFGGRCTASQVELCASLAP